jgi:hypothetical protein
MEGSLSKIASGELTLDAFMDWQVEWLGTFIVSCRWLCLLNLNIYCVNS